MPVREFSIRPMDDYVNDPFSRSGRWEKAGNLFDEVKKQVRPSMHLRWTGRHRDCLSPRDEVPMIPAITDELWSHRCQHQGRDRMIWIPGSPSYTWNGRHPRRGKVVRTSMKEYFLERRKIRQDVAKCAIARSVKTQK